MVLDAGRVEWVQGNFKFLMIILKLASTWIHLKFLKLVLKIKGIFREKVIVKSETEKVRREMVKAKSSK